jgi:hypothetical protein
MSVGVEERVLRKTRGNASAGVLIVIAIGLFLWVLLQRFANWLGVDVATAGELIRLHAMLIALLLLSVWFKDDVELIGPGYTWPLFLGGLWMCWWPVLEYKAAQLQPWAPYFPTPDLWWNSALFKGGVLVGLVVGGYLVRRRFRY